MIEVNARVNFKNKGSLYKPPISGMNCSFSVDSDLIMCQVFSKNTDSKFEFGKEYNVLLKLPYGEKYVDKIITGYSFTLNMGEREFATGIICLCPDQTSEPRNH